MIQDGFERFQSGRQAHLVAQVLGTVTGQETGHDAAEETGTQRACQHTADHAGSETRTVSDGVGNVTGQHRDHQGESGATTDLHQGGGQGAFHLECLDPEHERERDDKTAGDHHRQHKGDTGQQMLVGACLLFFLGWLPPLWRYSFASFHALSSSARVFLSAAPVLVR